MEHPRQGFIPTSDGGSLIFDNRVTVNSLIEEQCVTERRKRSCLVDIVVSLQGESSGADAGTVACEPWGTGASGVTV